MSAPTKNQVGTMLRRWRAHRSLSQLDLAYDTGVSPRHLSFVETGRSRPSPALIDALSARLDIPLRERNALLLAAGHAPRYSEEPLEAEAMSRVRASVQRVLDAHDPNFGVALDRVWNVVLANNAANLLVQMLPEHLRAEPLNLFRASLHPEGFAAMTRNFDVWGRYLVDLLRRLVRVTGDQRLADLDAELRTYPTVAGLDRAPSRSAHAGEPQLLVPLEMTVGDQVLSFFSTLTTFGSPRDITLEEMTIELFYPADAATESWLAAMKG
ncbi:putative Xre family DNA-binding protein [Gordonia araii NBRC 100433]|uniref:Putative Xre family DNA-binding protein n=1 Tax=Gordonia araii NBRC 100433 TaxID=1073574 RepID=G7GXM6_9ACTN|nr:helix-turn-helix transcriptional regulator [Gordonia araii]NNG98210.1 helix-turn-helix transcriptional regulator [Gordonia araii NBRC 100433]GAB08351.1 putative Xre family DNA-binding protein [Gordonia araii NBRC 100433]